MQLFGKFPHRPFGFAQIILEYKIEMRVGCLVNRLFYAARCASNGGGRRSSLCGGNCVARGCGVSRICKESSNPFAGLSQGYFAK